MALARALRGNIDEQRKSNVSKSVKKKTADSDLSSTRGSEDPQMSAVTTGRGQKRGRDSEMEKVRGFCFFDFISHGPRLALSFLPCSCNMALAAPALGTPECSALASEWSPHMLLLESSSATIIELSTTTKIRQLLQKPYLF